MSQDFVISGTSANGLPPVPHEVNLGGMRLCLLPPGPIDVAFAAQRSFVDINLNGLMHRLGVNSDVRKKQFVPPDTILFGLAGSTFSVGVENTLPGCYLELDEGRLKTWTEAADLDLALHSALHPVTADYAPDPVAGHLARAALPLLISHARRPGAVDRLTMEALGFSIAARALAWLERQANTGIDTADAAQRRADLRRIDRAVDWAEAHICDPMLTVSDMAAAANLSPSHFAQVFKSEKGETAYRYILRRRAECARDLVIGTTEPLSQIAYAVGFSSQAHMTYVMKRQFGATPASMR